MTPTQCKLQTASPIGLLISFHFSGTAGLLSGPPSYCYLRNCPDPIIIFCMTDMILQMHIKINLTSLGAYQKHNFWDKAANMFLIRSNKAVPNWLAHFSKTQRDEKPSKTFEDNGREARSCGIKQVLCSFCRSAINQFGFKDLGAVIPVVALFSNPANP